LYRILCVTRNTLPVHKFVSHWSILVSVWWSSFLVFITYG